MGFGVRYNRAERLARRHRFNSGGFGHNRKKGVHPRCTRKESKAVCCCHIKGISELRLWRGWAGEGRAAVTTLGCTPQCGWEEEKGEEGKEEEK